jgi:hypothetical protein
MADERVIAIDISGICSGRLATDIHRGINATAVGEGEGDIICAVCPKDGSADVVIAGRGAQPVGYGQHGEGPGKILDHA